MSELPKTELKGLKSLSVSQLKELQSWEKTSLYPLLKQIIASMLIEEAMKLSDTPPLTNEEAGICVADLRGRRKLADKLMRLPESATLELNVRNKKVVKKVDNNYYPENI